MPTNVTFEYVRAKKKYEEARTSEEKMKALEEMLSTVPKHKGTQTLQKEIKRKISRLKAEKIKQKQKKGKRKSIAIPKEGFQIVIIGFPNSGKSTLLKELTNADVEIADYAFTTKKPEVGILEYGGAPLQLVEIPALVEKAAEKQAQLMGLVHIADGIIMMLGDNREYEEKILREELKKFNVKKPILVCEKGKKLSKKKIFDYFGLIRVYTKEPGEEATKEKPLVLRKGSNVMQAGVGIHKDFVKKLKYVRVWGSSKFPGQRVDKDFVLKDKDIIEFHI